MKKIKLNSQDFNLSSFVKDGTRYVYIYKNHWDKDKKQARISERHSVGSIHSTGRLRFSKRFLALYPRFGGKVYYYRNNELMEEEKTREGKKLQDEPEFFRETTIRYGFTWALMSLAKDLGIIEDLKAVFGQDGVDLLRLAVYQLDNGGPMMNYEDWVPTVWLPGARPLCGQRISEILNKVNQEAMDQYFVLRFNRICQKHQARGQATQCNRPMFLAVDSTSINTYSQSIEDAAYGHAKQDEGLRQINFTLCVEYDSGDVCYGYESEGSVNDMALFPLLLERMVDIGLDLTDTVLVTDRGYSSLYNVQKQLDFNLKYIQGVKISEKSIKGHFKRYRTSLDDPAFIDGTSSVAARSYKEKWLMGTPTGEVATELNVFLYKDLFLHTRQVTELLGTIDKLIQSKNEGQPVDPVRWHTYRRFISEQSGQVQRNAQAISESCMCAGCFAIRSNYTADPFEALRIYRNRNMVESAFRMMKVSNGAERLRVTQSSLLGKLMVHVLAQGLRMCILIRAQKNKSSNLALPKESISKLIMMLQRPVAQRRKSGTYWIAKEVPKKIRDLYDLLEIAPPPREFSE